MTTKPAICEGSHRGVLLSIGCCCVDLEFGALRCALRVVALSVDARAIARPVLPEGPPRDDETAIGEVGHRRSVLQARCCCVDLEFGADGCGGGHERFPQMLRVLSDPIPNGLGSHGARPAPGAARPETSQRARRAPKPPPQHLPCPELPMSDEGGVFGMGNWLTFLMQVNCLRKVTCMRNASCLRKVIGFAWFTFYLGSYHRLQCMTSKVILRD